MCMITSQVYYTCTKGKQESAVGLVLAIQRQTGVCKHSQDKPRYGGPGRLKQCEKQKCINILKQVERPPSTQYDKTPSQHTLSNAGNMDSWQKRSACSCCKVNKNRNEGGGRWG